MKFTISYKFKLKKTQNLLDRSGPIGAADRPQETLYAQISFP